MQRLEKVWWDRFQTGRIEVQYCENCASTQFPPSLVCRNCSRKSKLTTRSIAGDGVRLAAKTVVNNATSPHVEKSIPYMVATFATSSGVRLTFPTCRLSTTDDAIDGSNFNEMHDSLENLQKANTALELSVCTCPKLALPHVAALQKKERHGNA